MNYKSNFPASIAIAIFLAIVVCPCKVSGQNNVFTGRLEASTGYISPDMMPFWLRANQFGDVPLSGASMGYSGIIKKDYDSQNRKLFDWGMGFNGKLNVGQGSDVRIIEGYGKARLWIFELKAGRSRDMMGLADSTLSVGAFSVSGTAPGIPKIEAGIPEFYTLPFLWNLFSIKGNFVHGWFGEVPMRLEGRVFPVKAYYHQKSFYGRLGNNNWRLKMYGGFNHQVQWGNEKDYYDEGVYNLTLPETYMYVVIGKAYGTPQIPRSKIGNHLGSIDIGAEYAFDNFKITAYRQNFYEVGALYYLANIRDGLNGLSFENTSSVNNGFRLDKVLLELFYSKNQAGELWSPVTPSGDENYYNNWQYHEGWSYNGFNMGNPLIGTREFIRTDLPRYPVNHFINNRVIAFHAGLESSFNEWDFTAKATYSLNYGTYGTSEIGHSLGTRRDPPRHGIFEETAQFSGLLQINRKFGNNMNGGVRTAFDRGGLYYNSAGVMLFFGINFK